MQQSNSVEPSLHLAHLRAPSAVEGGLGHSLLCPTGVLPLLGVIASSMNLRALWGYDLAVVERGLERTVVQARNSGRLKKTRVCSVLWVGGQFVIWDGKFLCYSFFSEFHDSKY